MSDITTTLTISEDTTIITIDGIEREVVFNSIIKGTFLVLNKEIEGTMITFNYVNTDWLDRIKVYVCHVVKENDTKKLFAYNFDKKNEWMRVNQSELRIEDELWEKDIHELV